uniref:Cytochrome c553 n=1 Tax=Candidatus Kentrum sp. DK TaxID=2126562 RepID=A0A450T133_9GAMM|nr:MAG: Cytochrome c553 [Candidatus Kentron sp. DK]
MRKFTMFAASAALAFGISGAALASDGGELFVAKGCSGCHGADAKSPVMEAYPKLAGKEVDFILAEVGKIKSGERNTTGMAAGMQAMLGAVSDEELKAIAEWISKQPE